MPFCQFTAPINGHDVNFTIQAEELTASMAYQLVKDVEQFELEQQRSVGSCHHMELHDPAIVRELYLDYNPEPELEGDYDEHLDD